MFNSKKIIKFFLYFFIAEIASLLVFLFFNAGNLVFILISALILFLCIKDLKYGLFILFAELFIGSKGYLFSLQIMDTQISIRIAIWLIVMSVWFAQFLINFIKNKKYSLNEYSCFFRSTKLTIPFFILFISLFWGVINAYFSGNSFDNIFFDANNWLFLLIIFPAISALSIKDNLATIFDIFLSAVYWLSIKTYLLLYLFSHFNENIIGAVYKWIRDTGVGEITQMDMGFYRIFFQSHLYIFLAFFIILIYLIFYIINNSYLKIFKDKHFYFILLNLSIFFSILLISLSRSFWIGLLFGLIISLFVVYNEKMRWKKIALLLFSGLISVFISLLLIILIVKFPFPSPIAEISPEKIISQRSRQISSEAAASSRWNLLPELLKEILKNPILGSGFGKTITYRSNDPRAINESIDGKFTSYAFEWGWLDIWLKIGLAGFIAYLTIIFKLFVGFFRFKLQSFYGFAISLISILVINIFTPFFNHPLGIGLLIWVAIIYYKNKRLIKI